MLLTLFPVFYAFCNPFDINDLETAFKTVLICMFIVHIFTKNKNNSFTDFNLSDYRLVLMLPVCKRVYAIHHQHQPSHSML